MALNFPTFLLAIYFFLDEKVLLQQYFLVLYHEEFHKLQTRQSVLVFFLSFILIAPLSKVIMDLLLLHPSTSVNVRGWFCLKFDSVNIVFQFHSFFTLIHKNVKNHWKGPKTLIIAKRLYLFCWQICHCGEKVLPRHTFVWIIRHLFQIWYQNDHLDGERIFY